MRTKTNEEFRKIVEDNTNNEYSLFGTYKNNKEKIAIKHNKCNNIFMMQPKKFIEGHRCPYCSKSRHKTLEEMRNIILQRYPSMYLVDGYTESTKPANFYHMDCCRTFSATPTEILRGKKCPFCSNKITGKSEEFQRKLNSKFYGNILLTEAYKGDKTKIQFCCTKCGTHFVCKPNDILKLNKCPNCNDDIDKEKIENFLNIASIPYKKNEIIFLGYIMKFDFFIEEMNLAIDYCGHAFYNNIPKVNIISNDKQKQRLKREYCKENKIKYLSIPYWENNRINEILYSLFMKNDKNTSYTNFNIWKRSLKIKSYKKHKSNHKQ